MKKLLLFISIAFIGCSKASDCYICEKDNLTYNYCEDSFYSPNASFDDQIKSLRNDGYDCDYYNR
jgi:hypothetical protein